jgi:hypothetical protein
MHRLLLYGWTCAAEESLAVAGGPYCQRTDTKEGVEEECGVNHGQRFRVDG